MRSRRQGHWPIAAKLRSSTSTITILPTGGRVCVARTDVSYASEPEAHYVLVSTKEPDQHQFRSYRIVDGVINEEPVEIVE